jgi:ribosome-associated toxin RatA of RatAB toxin-antitoxin module
VRFVSILLLFFWPGASFAADELSRADVALLQKGEPVVRVMRDAQSKSLASGRAFAAIDVPVPPDAVFAALTDCARAKTYVKNLVSCRVVKRDPKGAWEIRETMLRVSIALPDFRAVARVDYVRPKQVRFQQTEGSFDYAQGQWDLMPFRDGRATRLFYRVRAGTSVPIPEYVIQSVIESDLPSTLKALRAEAVRGYKPRIAP